MSHEHVVVQTGTKPSQQGLTPHPLPNIVPLFYSVREREREKITVAEGEQFPCIPKKKKTKRRLQVLARCADHPQQGTL